MSDPLDAKKLLAAVNQDLRNAIAIHAVYQKGARDKQLISKLDNSYAANAFNIVRDSLLHMIIAALCRMWDTNSDARSIVTLKRYLLDAGIQTSIIERRRAAMLGLESRPEFVERYRDVPSVLAALEGISEMDAAKAAADAQLEIETCLRSIEDARADPVVSKLKNFRDKIIAHSLEISRSEKSALAKGQTVETLKYGEEAKALDLTVPIVAALNLLLDDLHTSFDDVNKIWERYSREFWDRIQ